MFDYSYVNIGVVVEHFALHDKYRYQIKESFVRYRFRLFFFFITHHYIKYMQPLNFIANYYGEKMGFYFAFLYFYTSSLMLPAIPGTILFIYQIKIMWD
jgi:hypothetical protein